MTRPYTQVIFIKYMQSSKVASRYRYLLFTEKYNESCVAAAGACDWPIAQRNAGTQLFHFSESQSLVPFI